MKWKTPITLLKKSLVHSGTYIHKLPEGNFTRCNNQPYINEDKSEFLFSSHISIFKLAYEMVSDFHSVSVKLKDLSDNGDIYRLAYNENLDVMGEYISSKERLPEKLSIPSYQVTRKNIDMVSFGGFKIKDPKALCHSAIENIISELKKVGVDISNMKIRAYSRGFYSKAICASIIYSVDLGEQSTQENNAKAWFSLLESHMRELSIRPVHISFNGEILEDFSQEHFVIYENGSSCWVKDVLGLSSCSDKAYRDFLLVNMNCEWMYQSRVANEIGALGLKVKEDNWKDLAFVSSRELIENSGLVSKYSETEKKEEYFKLPFASSIIVSYLFESGFMSLNSNELCRVSVGNYKTDFYSSREFDLEEYFVSNVDYLESCALSKNIKKDVKSFNDKKKKLVKRDGKSKERYVAFYAVHTEPLTLIGFAKCTNKSRHLLKNFKYSCVRYAIEKQGRYPLEIPMVVLDCNDEQKTFIESIAHEHSSISKKIFAVKNNAYAPINGEINGEYYDGNKLLYKPISNHIFNESGIDICCVNYERLIWRDGDLLDYFTPGELNIIKSRSFKQGKNFYELIFSLAKRVNDGCKVSIIWEFDEFSRGVDLYTDGNVCILSANLSKNTPFKLEFHSDKITICVDGRESIDTDFSYKRKYDEENQLFGSLFELLYRFKKLVVCNDDELPKVTEKKLIRFLSSLKASETHYDW